MMGWGVVAALLLFPAGITAKIKWVDPDTKPIPAPREIEETLLWDIVDHTFFYEVGKVLDLSWTVRRLGSLVGGPRREADNVNALDEVPNSSWYTNRHALVRMSEDALAAGPPMRLPDSGLWTIVAGKVEGKAPGFTVRDAKGDLYLLKFDAQGAHELATAAEVISTRIYHAAGYNVPPNAIVHFRPGILVIGDGAQVRDADGTRRQMLAADLDAILEFINVLPHGRIRAVASKFLDGKPIGVFDFHDRRKDDPNDKVDHQHRRELRGLSVLAGWLNDTDRRAANTLNMWIETGEGLGYVRHYLIDMGATLGSSTLGPTTPKSGHEYFVDFREIGKSLLSAGLYRKAWETPVPMSFPEVGYFESQSFDPTAWDPNYPNSAFQRCTDRDGYWGAFADPNASEEMVRVLGERRDIIADHWFGRVNTADRFRVVGSEIRFEDLGLGATGHSGSVFRGTFTNPEGRSEGEGLSEDGHAFRIPKGYAGGTLVVEKAGADPVSVLLESNETGRLRIVGVNR